MHCGLRLPNPAKEGLPTNQTELRRHTALVDSTLLSFRPYSSFLISLRRLRMRRTRGSTFPRDHRAIVSNGPIGTPGVRNTTPSGTKSFAEAGRNRCPPRAFLRLTPV